MGVYRLKSIVSEQDFIQTMYSQISVNKVAEATPIAVNTWAWNNTYKAAHINVDATKKGTAEISLHYLKTGDVVKIKCEVMNITGAKAKVSLDSNTTNPTGSIDFADGGSMIICPSSKNGEFEFVEFTFVITKDAYYNVTFGISAADIGECYIRNCVVEIETIYDLNKNKKHYQRSLKQFTITVAPGVTGVYTISTPSTFDGATITVDSTLKCIYMDYTEPFTFTGKNPVAIFSQDATTNSKLYEFKNRTSSATRLRLEVWDKATNALIDPATVTGLIYFHVLIAGFDNIG